MRILNLLVKQADYSVVITMNDCVGILFRHF